MAPARRVLVVSSFVFSFGPLAMCWEDGLQVLSAKCASVSGSWPSCKISHGADSDAQAFGTFQDDIETSGWGRLLVKTPAEEHVSFFAAGYLEGYLTSDRVTQHLTNALDGAKLNPPTAGVVEFVEKADMWAQKAIEGANNNDTYWAAVQSLRFQFEGLVAGVRAGLMARSSAGQRSISRLDMLLLNYVWDMDDIKQAVNVSERADFQNMGVEAVTLWARLRGHCSSIVKLLPNASDIFAGHNTWMGYHLMLRIFKRYEFGSSTPIAMSSYPGALSSMDDFYQIGNLVVMETTLPNYNNDLFALVRPEALPFWVRAMVANRLAKSGAQWMDVFQRYNSGTYNNMWMVVDYNRFTPGRPLPAGVLTVGEQLPGYFHYEDQTKVLSYGYWPSYNAAVYPKTAKLIKQDVMEGILGNKFSYELVERAQIFRRDQTLIESDEDMQRIMRYNRYHTDPIAHGDPCSQLACRADLDPNSTLQKAFGAIDAKYTSLAHLRAGSTIVVSGPTHDDQPVFDWQLAPQLSAATSHVGHPQRFAFGWMVIGGPDLSASPWRSTSPAVAESHFIELYLATLVVATGVVFTAGVAGTVKRLRSRQVNRKGDSLNFEGVYKHLPGDPSVPVHTPVCGA